MRGEATRPAGAGTAAAPFDEESAYRMMLRMRLFENAVTEAWADGIVPGEYHSGIGEEGINAGVLLHLDGDDALALDHRNTAPFIGRGTDPTALLLELVGADSGLNRGMAGHMHLQDPGVRATADSIVGTSGPLAVGFAIAAERLRPGSVAVAFHGEAAMNQGMLMEAYNLAVAWRLPAIFVCKENRWSITTRTAELTASTPARRAAGFGLRVETASGADVADVFRAAGALIRRAREGAGPGLLYASCHRPGGHLEGDPLLRMMRDPAGEFRRLGPGLGAAVAAAEGTAAQRMSGVTVLGGRVARAVRDRVGASRRDPLRRAARRLPPGVAQRLADEEIVAVAAADRAARRAVAGRVTFGVGGGA